MGAAELVTLLGGGSVFTVLAVVIVYLLSSNRSDRTQALEAIAAAEKRADDAEKRADAAELREQAAQQRVDEERAARRLAEDQHAEVLRELRDVKARLAHLEARLAGGTI